MYRERGQTDHLRGPPRDLTQYQHRLPYNEGQVKRTVSNVEDTQSEGPSVVVRDFLVMDAVREWLAEAAIMLT